MAAKKLENHIKLVYDQDLHLELDQIKKALLEQNDKIGKSQLLTTYRYQDDLSFESLSAKRYDFHPLVDKKVS